MMDSLYFPKPVIPDVLCVGNGTDPLDVPLGHRILQKLFREFPGWDWRVEMPPKGNSVIIRNYTCNPDGKYGFFIRKDKVTDDTRLRCIVDAGGAFLEQYRQRVGGYQEGQVDSVEARIILPVDFTDVRPNGGRRLW